MRSCQGEAQNHLLNLFKLIAQLNMSKEPFILEGATMADIPALGKIFVEAFAEDRNTELKYLHKVPEAPYDMMTGALQHWMGRPGKCSVMKVVKSGQILGWMCWGFNGYDLVAEPEIVGEGGYEEGEHLSRAPPEIILSMK